MNKDRLKLLLLSLIVLSFVLSACAVTGDAAAPDASEAEGASKEFVICQLNTNLAEPWMVQMDEDIKIAAAEYPNDEFPNVTVSVQYKDALNGVLKQMAQLEECVIAGVDAILISPVEAGPMTKAVAEAIDAGIPVFLVARGVEGDKYTQYVGSDEFALGYAVGQWIVNNYRGRAPKVVEFQGRMTSTPALERHQGFITAIEGSDVEVIISSDVGWSEPNAHAEMESILEVYDEIDVVFGANDPSAYGAYIAAKNVGREAEIDFLGIDGLPFEGQGYVQDGILVMTIIDATGGDIALHNAVKYLMGGEIEKIFTKNAILFDENGKSVIEPPPD